MFVSFPTLSQEISGIVMGKTEASNSRAQDSQLMSLEQVCFPSRERAISGGERVRHRGVKTLRCEAARKTKGKERLFLEF